jgi:hypothetical protein
MKDMTTYIDYFKKLASAHKTPLDFYVMDINEFTGALRSSVKYPCLILNGLQGQLKSNTVDNVSDKTMGGFLIIDHCPMQQDYDREREIIKETKEIGLNIISRMENDRIECNEDHALLMGFDLNDVKYEMYGPVFDNDYGWNFTFTITDQLDLTYDPDQWTD